MPRVDTLNMLGKMFEKNIVPSENTRGVVTVEALYDVTFEEALQAVCGSEHTYVIKGNMIHVYHTSDSPNDI